METIMEDAKKDVSGVQEEIADDKVVENTQQEENKSSAEVEKLLAKFDEREKFWQGKFDTILQEKKNESQKALTVEERMMRLEEERKQERLDWSRKEAKAKAGIDDEFDKAVSLYSANDSDQIKQGAELLASIRNAEKASYEAKIKELEDKLNMGTSAPRTNPTGKSITMAEFTKLTPKEQAKMMENQVSLIG